MDSTDEILSDPQLREEALKGREEAKEGKTKKLSMIKRERWGFRDRPVRYWFYDVSISVC